jgi:hypothetical protein
MNRNIVIEFAATISEEELKWLTQRLTDRFSGDLSEALNFMSNHRGMDNILGSSVSAEELYNKCDEIKDVLYKECRKKGLILKGKDKVSASS